MGRPKGSKNKETMMDVVNRINKEQESQPVDHPDLTLTVRRLHVGSFSGLWELCRIGKDGNRTVITDANTKAMLINLARNEIIKCGQ